MPATVTTISTPGSSTYTPTVTGTAIVEALGGGAGSGVSTSGEGAGGAGMRQFAAMDIVSGVGITAVVGAAGAVNSNGVSSYVGDGSVIFAPAGNGGSARTGGVGGGSTFAFDDVNAAGDFGYPGGNGATSAGVGPGGTGTTAGGGGGGGPGGKSGPGANGSANSSGTGGLGGDAGTGGTGKGGKGGDNGVAGSLGTAAGAGGGGGGGGANGAAGKAGQIVVTAWAYQIGTLAFVGSSKTANYQIDNPSESENPQITGDSYPAKTVMTLNYLNYLTNGGGVSASVRANKGLNGCTIHYSGDPLGGLDGRIGTDLTPLVVNNSALKIVVVEIPFGNQSTQGGTAQDANDYLTAYVVALKALGWKVILITCTPESSRETYIAACNAILIADPTHSGADAFIDLTSNAKYTDNTNETWFQSDHTHWALALNADLAGIVAPVIAGLIPSDSVGAPSSRLALGLGVGL